MRIRAPSPSQAVRLALAGVLGVGSGLLAGPHPGLGQAPPEVHRIWRPSQGLQVGGEVERYLRVLQVAGKAPLYPWTLRGLTPEEVYRVLPWDPDHPWSGRLLSWIERARQAGQREGSVWEGGGPIIPRNATMGWVAPRAGALFNSAFPFGENDGPVWAGKGITVTGGLGFFFRLGRLHVRVAPEAFWAQNQDFALAPNGLDGDGAFRDGRFPANIDSPQRFGDEGYGRVDLGSSAIHLTLPGLVLGASGAGQQWGPALHYPLLLGNNAGGFPHGFIQTSHPLNFWLFRIHGRLLGGILEQSDYSPVQYGETRRFASGAMATLMPRGLTGLEVGVTRFVQMTWPEDGIGFRELTRPFGSTFNEFEEGDNPRNENQLSSAFFRWTVPSAGIEVYGELIREDFARDLRHNIEEPDDLLGRTLGFQKVWVRSQGRLAVLRGEVVSAQVHHSERMDRFADDGFVRPFPRYIHGGVRQGHTHYGQILGSPTVYGGSGWTLGADFYGKRGRVSVDLSRALQAGWLRIHAGGPEPEVADVIYALKLEIARFWSGARLAGFVVPAVNLNRNVKEGNHVWNLGAGFAVEGVPW